MQIPDINGVSKSSEKGRAVLDGSLLLLLESSPKKIFEL
jgi:hypothetical protein